MALLEWGLAGQALAGDESGDLHVVAETANTMLLAVIDGLGHGPEAAVAAKAAAGVLQADPDAAPAQLLTSCHQALRETRGAVMSLISLEKQRPQLTWVGVGNVETLLLRTAGGKTEGIVSPGGIVGYQLPRLRPATLTIAPGDWLVLASDGLKSGFVRGLRMDGHPQREAERLLAEYQRGTDDALVLVARYLGP